MSSQFHTGAEQAISDQHAERLDSWKEIAGYLKRDIRTVQRWEKEEGLPVHRLAHKKRGSVFAHRNELDLWWSQRGGLLEKQEESQAGSKGRIGWAAGLLVVTLAALVAGWVVWNTARPGPLSASPVRITASSAEVRELFARGFSFLWYEREPDGAMEVLSEAWRLDPNCASCAMHLAWAKFDARHPAAEYQPIADRALELSEALPLDERFMNRGLFYEIVGDKEKALGAYKGLAELHPDDIWAVTAVTYTLLNLGREVETASHWAKLAELRPDNFEANVKAGCLYYEMGGDEARAAPFIQRAQALAPSVSLTDMGRVWIEFLPAFEAWQQGDMGQVEFRLQKAEQMYASGREATWQPLIQQMVQFYMALGQFNQAERWLSRSQNSGTLSPLRLAFAQGEKRTVLDLTDKSASVPLRAWEPPIVRAWFSPDEQVETMIEQRKKANLDQRGAFVAQGVLEHRRGRNSEAISLLRRSLPMIPEAGWTHLINLCLGSEVLAAALEETGDMSEAVRVLESIRRRKQQNYGFGGNQAYYWMRTQIQLVRLYKKVGREEEASKLGSELLNLLSKADRDNPMLLELSALMKPAN